MTVIPMIPPSVAAATMRCECARCGAHVVVRRSWQLSGMCGNCRSYDLQPLAPVPQPPPAGPMAGGAAVATRLDLPLPARIALPATRVA